MKLVSQENLRQVLEERDAMAVINAFARSLRKKAYQIIHTHRYASVIEYEDLVSAGQLEIVQVLREGKFKYKPEQTEEHNWAQFVTFIEMRIKSAVMREKDNHAYPIHVRRGIVEKLRTTYQIIARRKQAPRSVIVNLIAYRCKATLHEAIHLSKIASLSFHQGLTYLSHFAEEGHSADDDYVDFDIPMGDENMDELVVTDLFTVLEVPFHRALLTRVIISNCSLHEIAKQYKLPFGYINKHYKLALARIKEEITQ